MRLFFRFRCMRQKEFIHGLWVAMALDELFRAVVMFFRWHGAKWNNKQVAK